MAKRNSAAAGAASPPAVLEATAQPVAVRPTANALATVYDYGTDKGAGAKDITGDDKLVPFLRILQTNSPQVNPGDPKYIAGAQAGMLLNTSSSRVYPGTAGLTLVVAGKNKSYARFVPRDQGGGFDGQLEPNDPMVLKLRNEQGERVRLKYTDDTPDLQGPRDRELVETFYVFVQVGDANGNSFPACVAFTSTGITPYKAWMTALDEWTQRGVPLFGIKSRMTTVGAKNKKGSFFKYKMALDGDTPDAFLLSPESPLYNAAKRLRHDLAAGVVKADLKVQEDEGGGTGGEDEIPF